MKCGVNIDKYSFVSHAHLDNKRGGGVGFYIKNGTEFNIYVDIECKTNRTNLDRS